MSPSARARHRWLTAWWRRIDPSVIRDRVSNVNDGILTIAGTSLGLAGAEIGVLTSYTVLVIAGTVGAPSVLATELNEGLSDVEAEHDAAEHELSRMLADPNGEILELAQWFEDKGVSTATARQVAEELTAADPLDARLELEHGIEEVTTVRTATIKALSAAIAFFAGAALPTLLQVILPVDFRTWYTLPIAATSLIVTAIVLAPRGHYNVALGVLRSLVLGLITLTLTYWIGDALM